MGSPPPWTLVPAPRPLPPLLLPPPFPRSSRATTTGPAQPLASAPPLTGATERKAVSTLLTLPPSVTPVPTTLATWVCSPSSPAVLALDGTSPTHSQRGPHSGTDTVTTLRMSLVK